MVRSTKTCIGQRRTKDWTQHAHHIDERCARTRDALAHGMCDANSHAIRLQSVYLGVMVMNIHTNICTNNATQRKHRTYLNIVASS